jgi:GNAT superfamily N-acetyltransferase
MNPEIRIINSSHLDRKLREQVLALCSDAYEEDFTPYLDLLAGATHVLAVLDGRLVSHAAWIRRELRVGKDRRPLSCAYVEAVATPVRLQRQGLGTQVLRAIPALVTDLDLAALSPSEPDFYARSGWEMWQGPLFYIENGERNATPEEEVMILRLPNTPTGINLRDELEADWRAGDVW